MAIAERLARDAALGGRAPPSLPRPLGAALGVVLLSLAGSCAATADDAVFTVGNYPVEARAENAVSAKSKALADGQQAALHSLLKRLVPVTAYQRLRPLRQIPAGDLVEGVRVRSERNSSTDYIASLDFAFEAKGVRDLLRREGIPFTEEQAPQLTVVALWRSPAQPAPREEPAWSNVWKGLDLEHALTPVRLQALRRELAPDAVNQLAQGDDNAIRGLVAAYGGELVVLAVADQDLSAKRLTVTLAGRDAAGAFLLKRAYRIDPTDPGYASELAAVVSLGILEGRWKALKLSAGAGAAEARVAAPAAADSALMIAVEFRGMSEWQEIGRKLAATPGIEDLEVAGLSARNARLTLRYGEGAERLAQALAQQGLSLRNAGGSWVLSLQ